mmetsp:Transcript_139424/g.445958  ORF Transcript_139424/g.445958 Transcript_139424/m.445958 type:complete len:210 (-) Transcript_139424:870-1499(-)
MGTETSQALAVTFNCSRFVQRVEEDTLQVAPTVSRDCSEVPARRSAACLCRPDRDTQWCVAHRLANRQRASRRIDRPREFRQRPVQQEEGCKGSSWREEVGGVQSACVNGVLPLEHVLWRWEVRPKGVCVVWHEEVVGNRVEPQLRHRELFHVTAGVNYSKQLIKFRTVQIFEHTLFPIVEQCCHRFAERAHHLLVEDFGVGSHGARHD